MATRVIAEIYLTLNPNKYLFDMGVKNLAAALSPLPPSRTLHEEAIILAGRN